MHLANHSSGKPDTLAQSSSRPDKLSQSSVGGTLDIREALRGSVNQSSRELEQPEREDDPQK